MRYTLSRIKYQALFGLLSLLCIVTSETHAQTTYCPPNLDFEQGNLSNWYFYTGNCCPITANTLSGPVNYRHVLTSGTQTDPYGGFPIVAPGGGGYSLKLGNNGIGRQAERARYFIHVPNNQANYIFIYRYAVVFQDPNHSAADQPRFEVTAYDSASGTPVPCNSFTYVASSKLPGFTRSSVGSNVFYKPWTTSSINLSGYGGRTIALDFASGDCNLGGHFGYGYVDMNCGLFQINGSACNGDTSITLTAPPGFQFYKWMDTTFTKLIDTTANTVVAKSQALKKYALIVTPYAGFGCPDTFYTQYVEDTVGIHALVTSDTAICKGGSVKLSASAISSNLTLQYQWFPAQGLSCTTCASPTATPSDSIRYYVAVKNNLECIDTASVKINISVPVADAGPDTSVCAGDSVMLQGSGKDIIISQSWAPTTLMTNPSTFTPKVKVNTAQSFYLTVTDKYNCKHTDTIAIQLNPAATVDAGNDQAGCPGDSVTLHATAGQGVYQWTPGTGLSSTTTLTPKVITAVSAKYFLTATNVFGCKATDSVTVSQHPVPIPSAGNDTTICFGTTLKLLGTANMQGSYYWSPANKVSNPNIQNPDIYADSERVYRLRVTSANGCKDSDDVKVSIYVKPVADAGRDTGACISGTVMLAGKGADSGGVYTWTPATGLSNANIANPVVTVSASNTYTLYVSSVHNCKDTDQVLVTLYPDPVADAGPDTALCRWDRHQLKGKGGTLYRWQPLNSFDNPYVDTPKIIVTGNASYQLTVYNQYGCKDIDSINISTLPQPVADAGPDTAICKNQLLKLKGTGGVYYAWYPVASVSNPSLPDPWVHGDTQRQYTLVVTNSFNCNDTDDVLISVNPLPVANAGADKIGCMWDTVVLEGSGGGSYQWYPQRHVMDSTAARPTVHITDSAAVYYVKVTNMYGCSDTDDVKVMAHSKPLAVAGSDTLVCPGAKITLQGSGGTEYRWYPAKGLSNPYVASPVANITGNIIYSLVITDVFGCKDTGRIRIDTIPVLFTVEEPDIVCAGQEVKLQASGGQVYKWFPDSLLDNSSIAAPIAKPPVSTLFNVVIKETTCNRTDTFTIQARISPLPQLKIEAINMDCGKKDGLLSATGAKYYKWFPEDGLEDPNAAKTIARPVSTTRYILTGVDSLGCTDTASVYINVYEGDGRLFIPNAFTPNGDGLNDCYRVFVPGDVTEFDFSVYNRFGERVFHASTRDHCWDGNYKGTRAELGTYFYYYQAVSSVCGKIFRKGDMHLLR